MIRFSVVTNKKGVEICGYKVVKEEVIRVRVDKDLKDRLKKMCKNKKITMSEMITFMIENEVKSYEFKLKHSNNTEKENCSYREKAIEIKRKVKFK